MNLANIFQLLTIYNLLTSMDSSPMRVTTRTDKILSRYKRDLTLQRQFPSGAMGFLMMMLPLLPLALRKSRSFAVLMPIPVPMRNQQPPTIQKGGGNSDLMLMMMMMMSMMKNMDGKPSHPWGTVSNWPPPPNPNPWPSQPAKDPWPTTTPAPDPWPSPAKDPWPTTTPTPDPWSTKPPDPWASKPSDPWGNKPSDPWPSKPADPWPAKPADPWAKPSNPWETKPSNPWEQGKPSNPWDQTAKPTGNPWDQGKQPSNPWDQWKGGAANLWDQLKNVGNPWKQPSNPWNPIDNSNRKSSPDWGYGDSDQYAAMMNQMANMLKYYMKNMTTTTPAPAGKMEDCPKCNVQVNINNSNASPRHNQTQTTSYGVKKRSKEAKIAGTPGDPVSEAPIDDGATAGPPVDAPPEGVDENAPFDPNNPDQPPIPEDPSLVDGGGGGEDVDLDGDGFRDPTGQQVSRFGQQRQNLAHRRRDKGARRLNGHSLGRPMILPHEPYNGVRYAVPKSKLHERSQMKSIQYLPPTPQQQPHPPSSSPFTPHQILLHPPQGPAFMSPAMVPVAQPGYPGRAVVYTQDLPNTFGLQQQQQPVNQPQPYYQVPNIQGGAFVPAGSTRGNYNQISQQLPNQQLPQSGTAQYDDSQYEIIKNSESQRESDYSHDKPKSTLESETKIHQGKITLLSNSNPEDYNTQHGGDSVDQTGSIVIGKPVLGKPPRTHKAPMEYRAFIENNNNVDGTSSTTFSSTQTNKESSNLMKTSINSRMDYESEKSTSITTANPPVYIQQRSSQDESQETINDTNNNQNNNRMMIMRNNIIRESLPSSASQPRPLSTLSSSLSSSLNSTRKALRDDRDNFRANGPSPSPLTATLSSTTVPSKPNFRVDDRSKQLGSDAISPTSSNGIESSSSSSTTTTPKSIIPNIGGDYGSTNSSTVFYTFPLSIESSSSSESRFPDSTTTPNVQSYSAFSTPAAVYEAKFIDNYEKYDPYVDQKMVHHIGQENGTYLWKEISNHINKDNISNYLSEYNSQTASTLPTTISIGRVIDYDQVNNESKTIGKNT
ncbi:trithorax group protein osa-like [Panonychus citri]|uniref:trithorax group protein osa-like n=1 Tax=Panonychus citri TaxID=50023 RepID=UPI00230779C3|nr:trithorax group protein osa-like [Panonychus citri]